MTTRAGWLGAREALHPERPISLDPGEVFQSMGLRAEGGAEAVNIAQGGEGGLVACGAVGLLLATSTPRVGELDFVESDRVTVEVNGIVIVDAAFVDESMPELLGV